MGAEASTDDDVERLDERAVDRLDGDSLAAILSSLDARSLGMALGVSQVRHLAAPPSPCTASSCCLPAPHRAASTLLRPPSPSSCGGSTGERPPRTTTCGPRRAELAGCCPRPGRASGQAGRRTRWSAAPLLVRPGAAPRGRRCVALQLLTAHDYSLLTTHHSLRTTHYPLPTAHHTLLITHHALRTTHSPGLPRLPPVAAASAAARPRGLRHGHAGSTLSLSLCLSPSPSPRLRLSLSLSLSLSLRLTSSLALTLSSTASAAGCSWRTSPRASCPWRCTAACRRTYPDPKPNPNPNPKPNPKPNPDPNP